MNMRIGSVLVLGVLLASASAASADPIIGLYKSYELGGLVLDGRWSEGYPAGLPGQIGNRFTPPA